MTAEYWSARRISPGGSYGPPVVAEAHGAGLRQLPHLGQLGSRLSLRDRGQEAHRHLRLGLRRLDLATRAPRRVQDGIGVRHREDRAIATGGGGLGARGDRLLVLAARRPEVDVRVDERRREQQSLSLDDSMGVRVEAGPELGDRAAVDADVEDGVDLRARIEDTGAADDQVFAGRILT